MAGSFNITGHSETEPAGERNFGPITIQGTVVIGETLAQPLVSGDNHFSVPESAVACLIVPPVNSAAELKLRTNKNESDGGLPISESNPTLLSFDKASAPTALIIHASAAVSSPITIAYV
jgi:hypothetical protein